MNVTATGRNGKIVYIMSANKDTQDLVDINIISTNTITTAEIKLKGTLDRETLSQRTVIIKACDCSVGCSGCIAATKDFTIFVTDVNDEAPVFQNLPYQCEIPENAGITTTIDASIKAVDRDNGLGGQVRYYLTAKALYNGAFSIGIYSGILEIQRNLDYETLSFYQYTVTAADHYNKSTAADVLIKIKDVQDKPPFFQGLPYLRYIPETSNLSALGEILKVKASDGDTGVPNQIEYHLENGSSCRGLFKINTKDGSVTATKILDRDEGVLKDLGGYCLINVTAYEVGDNVVQYGKNTSTTLITINVEDVNDNKPEFSSSHYDAHVMEGTASIPITINGSGIKLQDKDQGKNSHLNLTVQFDNGTSCYFLEATPSEIYGSGDILIRLSNTFRFDYETTKSMGIKVVATEIDTSEHWSASCDVDINIIDVNDNDPIFAKNEYRFNVTEDAMNDTEIGQINATDEDSGKYGTISFMLRGGNGKFRIDPQTGVLYTNGDNTTLDREIKDVYYLTAIAEDGGSRRTTVSIQINLLDINDNEPMFERPIYTASLKENSLNFSNGELIVRATDNDERKTNNSFFKYGIEKVSPTLVHDHFKANGTTGQISITKSVDYEALATLNTRRISIIITAADYGEPSLAGTTTLDVTVIDENDNTPQFTVNLTHANIPEDSTPGDNVTSVIATDGDAAKPNNDLSYFIQKGSDKFRIDSSTGYIKVELNAKFDRETIPSYNLTIIAIDKGDPQLTGTTFVSIDIDDVNDEKPKFDEDIFSTKIKENLPVGTSVITCGARDADLDYSLHYNIEKIEAFDFEYKKINASLVENYFQINELNGSVYATSKLDAETATQVILTLNVTDVNGTLNTPQYDIAKLTITLEDVNDEAPAFDEVKLFANLSESAVKGAIVTTVQATDRDITAKNREISYSLSVNPFNAFQIDHREGKITLKEPTKIDREKNDTLMLEVTATDSVNNATVTVDINVLDANDNTPFFLNNTYQFNITEGNYTTKGYVIGTVLARDNDIGNNALISYHIVSTDHIVIQNFEVNETTGELKVTGNIDRESITGKDKIINIKIQARDNPSDVKLQHVNTTDVKVYVLDVNDNAPTFGSFKNRTEILETVSIGTTVLTVGTSDPDEGESGHVTYFLGSGSNSSDLFVIDPDSGRILTNGSFLDNVVLFKLEIIATDHGSPSLNNTIDVFVNIRDTNNNDPKFYFQNGDGEFGIFECAKIGTLVTIINATDKDHGENGRISYSFEYTNGSFGFSLPPFLIDNDNGSVILQNQLDSEKQIDYTVTIRIQDHGIPKPRTSTKPIQIKVIDVNDNPPEFSEQEQRKTVYVNENTENIVVAIVKAYDNDTNSKIAYSLDDSSPNASNFTVDRDSGKVTLISELDREKLDTINLTITATDVTNTAGDIHEQCKLELKPRNVTSMNLVVKINDENDNPPEFRKKSFSSSILRDKTFNGTILDLTEYVLPDPDTLVNSKHEFYMLNISTEPKEFKSQVKKVTITTKCKDGQLHAICVDTDGKVRSNMQFTADMRGFFILRILSNDTAGNDTTRVKVCPK
ncbi:hypothetical protein FSP39_018308 [Pinctada imbricata]|uniref:Cadherin domain-containing protein n=1 Tax=Pinctada imbricata TaxID=66713 RepID=A0AA89BUG2_PINIB|nr:hypothetical protein FSP39_018308 [Pinctada imbricata]